MSVQDLYEAAYCQDIGARHEQQDRVEILWSDAACLVVLADGLGGHIRGAFAAQTAIDLASSTFERATPRRSTPGEIFKTIVLNANERLNDAAEGLFSRGFPGTTCVLLHLTKAKACWTHLGDSRLYRFKDGRITEKTNDHSYPGGGMSACLGAGFNSPGIQIRSEDISESDGFLLCSDGLWGNVTDEQLEAVFETQDLPGALRELVSAARARGGARCDNISVAAVRLAR